MAIHKVYPELRCKVCGNVLETEEPETEHVFILLVLPCYVCAAREPAQKSAQQAPVKSWDDEPCPVCHGQPIPCDFCGGRR